MMIFQIFLRISFRCRGQIKVKGKGDMVTYFFCDQPLSGEVRGAMLPNVLQNYPIVQSASKTNNFQQPSYENGGNGNYQASNGYQQNHTGEHGLIKSRSEMESHQNYTKDETQPYMQDYQNHQNRYQGKNGGRTPNNGNPYANNYAAFNAPHVHHAPPQPPQRSYQNFNIIENPHTSNNGITTTTPLLQKEMYSNSNLAHEQLETDNFNEHHIPHHINNHAVASNMMRNINKNNHHQPTPKPNGCREDEPLLHNPTPMARQHNPPKYEPPRYAAPSSQQQRIIEHQNFQQQHLMEPPPKVHQPMMRVYMKPLPKLPAGRSIFLVCFFLSLFFKNIYFR